MTEHDARRLGKVMSGAAMERLARRLRASGLANSGALTQIHPEFEDYEAQPSGRRYPPSEAPRASVSRWTWGAKGWECKAGTGGYR